ncbi:MAG TPA: dienelactone hydrolase family protein [Acidimicrobiia bacterium]|nr:dienelactone hydrolase family protein [Acidimicrobiia bacterium]
MTKALDGFTATEFSHDGITRPVYAAGTGPAVIVMHEIPGLHPGVIDFGRRVVDRGFHVRMPSLFGTPGKKFSAGYSMRSMVSGCVAKEFTSWALNRTSPVSSWLRALSADAHETCGGAGVGAVGMCFTGGFALGMMLDDRLRAPVLSQPSLPFAMGKRRKASVGISDADLEVLSTRAAAGACVMGLRFTGDPFVPAARFDTLRDMLGDGFIAVEIDSLKGNPHGIKRTAHSVLTLDLVDEPGHPTHAALERVLDFFDERLR